MTLLCPCGVDCSDFIAHHHISADSRFNCPACDNVLRAASAAHAESALLELTQEPDMLKDAGLTSAAGVAHAS